MRILLSLVSCAVVAGSMGLDTVAGDDPPLQRLEAAVQSAISRGELPGAVILIVHRDEFVFRKAFGQRSLVPNASPMNTDIVFDLASLTKPIVTATAIMLLIEQGKLNVNDRLAQHLTAFRRKETEDITLEHLLLHTSGFIADNPIADYRDGRAKARERLFALNPVSPPGTKFVYSDVGYILLGEVVEKVSQLPLEQLAQKHIFETLGMKESGYGPSDELKRRAAPTENRDGRWLQGEVHDPRAALLGGVAGHAGLFSTADDLAKFARMLLARGKHKGRAFLKESTIDLMTAPRQVPGKKEPGLRTYGWDMATSFSSNRGDVFAKGVSYGHTGFTGTSIWLDPGSQTAVIFLSNRVHPNGKGNVTKLRAQVSTLAGTALLLKK